MNERRDRRIALHAWSALGALLLGSIVFLPPAVVPDADTPLAIEDASGDASVSKSPPDAPVGLLAPPPPPGSSLPGGGLAARRGALPGLLLEIETDLPTRAPPE